MTFDPRAVAQALGGNVTAAPLQIVFEPTASGRKSTARLGDHVLCVTAWPFVMSARLLLAEGFPADTVIEIWRPNSDEWALKGRLGAVAAIVIDGETAPRRAKNGSPASAPEQDGHMKAPPVCARPGGRFSCWIDDGRHQTQQHFSVCTIAPNATLSDLSQNPIQPMSRRNDRRSFFRNLGAGGIRLSPHRLGIWVRHRRTERETRKGFSFSYA